MAANGDTSSDQAMDVSDESSSASSASAESTTVESPDGAQLQVDELIDIIGEEEAEKLLAQAETNADAYWIASHIEEFEFEGETVEWKILKLAADEPLSLGYVRDFAEKYPQDEADMDPALAMDESYLAGTKFDTGVPHLYQWDRRWGQIIYCSTTFGLTGCGPACMAMVYQGLTGNDDLTPYDMAIRAQEGGYMAQFEGTSTGFFFAEADADGLYCRQIDISADSIRESLYNGEIIIANLGQGYFTIFGHFFVLVGVDENGDIIINDPYSEVRSTQTWDADLIANESIALFAFGLA